MRLNNRHGFSLVELIVAVGVFGIAMAAAMAGFLPVLQHAQQQSTVAETEIEKLIGFDLLRIDVEQAGLGVPWEDEGGWNYDEAQAAPASKYNDGLPGPLRAPRAIVAGDDVGTGPASGEGINDSDYLVVRAVTVRSTEEAHKWTYITLDPAAAAGGPAVKTWGGVDEDMEPATRVIAIQPAQGSAGRERVLLRTPTGAFWSQFANVTANFPPVKAGETFLLYGVEDNQNLTMPFNRADFWISSTNVPGRCAPGTGVLVKSVLNQPNGQRAPGLPLIDCVADFQVVFGWDMDENNVVGTYSNADGSVVTDSFMELEGSTALEVQNAMATAKQVRKLLREIRIYVLGHEGQANQNFDFGATTIDVGDPRLPLDNLAHVGPYAFDLSGAVGYPEYKYYRWRLYSLVIKPENLL